MNGTQWIIFILIIQVIHFLGTWKLYVKAGRKAWEAAIPIYNAIVLMQIINRPKWWVVLLFIPIINLLMFPVVWVETIRSFGKNKLLDTWLVILTLGFYIYYINYVEDVNYIEDRSLKPRTGLGEWVSSIVFAIVAATLVHTYFIQPYVIPTGSLERTLRVGDFLFVSKFHFGARTPMTAVAAPMVHDTIPIIKKRSYLNKPQIPYFRLPGFETPKKNDIVVFSWPADTVTQFFVKSKGVKKPIDKKSNYVKRCVGTPGIQTDEKGISADIIRGLRLSLKEETPRARVANMTDEMVAQLKKNKNIDSIVMEVLPKGEAGYNIFPQNPYYKWNVDNFGPIYIPEEGATVKINAKTIPFYKKIIRDYEKNDVKITGDKVFINGKEADAYTFKQDYYWMMGDNRDHSEDSRAWGYVAEDHIVGKPVFIWMSFDNFDEGISNWKFRWDRIFTTVGGSGEPKSYFKYFIGLLIAWFVFDFFRKRRKSKTA